MNHSDSDKTTLAAARPGWVRGLEPTPVLTVSDWADKFRVLNSKSSAEEGEWRTSRTPYLRQIMEDLSNHSDVRKVTIMKGAQIGGTELGNNWVGYVVDHAPGSMLVVQPTVDMAKLWSRQRFAPMVADMDCLREKIEDARSRDSANTVLLKEFPGGLLRIAGGNSASGLRSMPVKNLFLDEVDSYPLDVDGEGDPVELAINRTKTYSRKKIFQCSTPTQKGSSRIDDEFHDGNQSYYHVPCPHCEEKQVLSFQQLKFERDPDDEDGETIIPGTVKYLCEHCGEFIDERYKTWMMAEENGAEWRATKKNDKHHSYQISSLYSPIGWESWQEIAEKFLKAAHNPEKLKTFTNTTEGLPYEEKTKIPQAHQLEKRAEDYPLRVLPIGCLLLTCGVDVQDNRLEYVVWGHGARQRWIIDRGVFWGSPSNAEVWTELNDYLTAPFEHSAGRPVSISATAIDSGGLHTQYVYDFCRLRSIRRIIAVKGQSQKNKPVIGKPTKVDVSLEGETIRDGAEVWPVGSDTAKDMIYNFLEIDQPDADGYVHFSTELESDFYKQLTSEKKKPRYIKGMRVYDWILPPGKRNEVLDCSVYAFAAYYMLGLHRWRSAQWRQLESKIQPPTQDLFANPETQPDAVVRELGEALESGGEISKPTPKKTSKKRTGRRRGNRFTESVLSG